MEQTLETFKAQQSQSVELLNKLLEFLAQGEEAGVPVDPALRNKLQTARQAVADEKLKVALIGGFSEGKTSIAAAWMEQLDRSTMKISHQESSNEVVVYDCEDFELVDTPGLFGFEEKFNAESRAIEKYKDITRKYVSEAHLVLYVMNPTNPIKESHKDDLVWLFRTLNLLPRTVFVLSRFDEVADVEDEEDYQSNLSIKRENVIARLRDLVELSDEEAAALSIVAVAANPFDMGVEHWLANIEEFRALSHIETLQAATAEQIRANGGSTALVAEMHNSVISDVLSKQLPVAIENEQTITQEVAKLAELHNRLHAQIAATERQIEDVRINLREFAVQYFSDLILQARGCSLETFGEFFEREIGNGGVIIATRLQNEFSRQTQSITLEVQRMQLSFDTEVNHFNTMLKAVGQQGINHLVKGNVINNTTVLAARDGIVSLGKTVGLDLGKHLKFKPWGATNFAKGLNGVLAFMGVALEAWDSWEQHKREETFQSVIADTVSNFEKQREDLLNLINAPKFKEKFFSDYLNLKQSAAELEDSLKRNQERQKRFQAWREAAQTIEAEFEELHKIERRPATA